MSVCAQCLYQVECDKDFNLVPVGEQLDIKIELDEQNLYSFFLF